MSGTLEIGERVVDVWGGRVTLRVKTAGRGAPVVYLHPAAGLSFDPFLVALSTDFSIFAPEIPGTSAGDPNAIHNLDSGHVPQVEQMETTLALVRNFLGDC